MAYNSTIIQKKCKCGCDKYPTLGYRGYFVHHVPLELQEELKKGKVDKRNKSNLNNLSKKVKSFAKGEDAFREGGKSKSELLKEADKLFADFIKKRDTGLAGNVFCPCCGKVFNSKEEEVNCMHFIDRDVYSLRFNEDAAHAGHASCNRNQHYEPSGVEYQNFKAYLIKKLGETDVAEMEVAHRKINRIESVMLQTVIELYS